MRITKAQQVEAAYDDAAWDIGSNGAVCYELAVAAAITLGGVELENSNDSSSSKSFAPTRTFEFDDLSSVQVRYGSVYVID